MDYPKDIAIDFKSPHNAPAGVDNSDQYPESLVRYFLKNYAAKNDRVFDPFLGFGTTAFVAQKMGRIPYGIEADRSRFEWAAGQLTHWNNIVHGDSGKASSYAHLPKMDFCITSPPYMPIHHKWNPLYGGDPKYAGYETYLKRMGTVFKQVQRRMKRNALVIMQADNLEGRKFTPLVRDLSMVVGRYFRPEADIIVRWKNARADYPYTHALVFKNVL